MLSCFLCKGPKGVLFLESLLSSSYLKALLDLVGLYFLAANDMCNLYSGAKFPSGNFCDILSLNAYQKI